MKKLIALLLVAVFTLSFAACGGVSIDTSSPEGAVRTFLNAIANRDDDTYIAITVRYNTSLVEKYSSLNYDDKAEALETIKAEADAIRNNANTVSPIKINIKSIEVNADYELNNYEEDLLKSYGLSDAVEDYTVMYYKISYLDENEARNLPCVKIDGKWYIISAR